MRAGLAALVAGLSLVVASAAFAAPSPDLVTIKDGVLKGVVAEGVASFKNIPFAAPPVGPLRWKPPQKEASWSGVRDATAFGPTCMQVAGMFGGRGGPASEDCLQLNVYTPADRPKGKRLPVMVWIYGGGFVGGAASYYNGASFARDGVVLVTVNYRLGRLGWFAHPGLTAEAAQGHKGGARPPTMA